MNRIDDIIVFHSLTEADLEAIARLLLQDLASRISQQQIDLTVSAPVVQELVKEGTDLNYGARPLRRAIQRLVEDPFSEALLRQEFGPGDRVEAVLDQDGNIAFQKGLAASQQDSAPAAAPAEAPTPAESTPEAEQQD